MFVSLLLTAALALPPTSSPVAMTSSSVDQCAALKPSTAPLPPDGRLRYIRLFVQFRRLEQQRIYLTCVMRFIRLEPPPAPRQPAL